MTIRLDHTIVPAKDKIASAAFFAEIFGLTVRPDPDHFAQVQVNESLTLDFGDEPEAWGGSGFDPGPAGATTTHSTSATRSSRPSSGE